MSEEKSARVQDLCKKLLSNQDYINSGKIQFINFEKVRDHMGPRWKAVETIVFNIADQVILKHVSAYDLYFRYNKDDYMIFFATSTFYEAQTKCHAIATEIQSLLFGSLSDYPEMHELSASCFVRSFCREDFNSSPDYIKSISDDLSSHIEKEVKETKNSLLTEPLLNQSSEKSYRESLGVDPSSDYQQALSLEQSMQEDESASIKSRACESVGKFSIEIPVPRAAKPDAPENKKADAQFPNLQFYTWPMVSRNKTRRNILIVNDITKHADSDLNPVERHINFLGGMDKRRKALYEMIVLEQTLKQLRASDQDEFCCQVSFETILSAQYEELCKERFASLTHRERNRLAFVIKNIPPAVPSLTISRLIAPFKQRCSRVCAYLPFKSRSTLSNFVNYGFKGVGFMITEEEGLTRAQLLEEGSMLTKKCHQYGLTASILIASRAPGLADAAYKADFDFISSLQGIHPVNTPQAVSTGKRLISAATMALCCAV